jgi:hypothetical protein
VEDSVAGCFKGEVRGPFVEISEGTAGAVDLNGKSLLLPKEVDHYSSDAFSGHALLRSGAAESLPLDLAAEI